MRAILDILIVWLVGLWIVAQIGLAAYLFRDIPNERVALAGFGGVGLFILTIAVVLAVVTKP